MARRHERLWWILALAALVLGCGTIAVAIAQSSTSASTGPASSAVSRAPGVTRSTPQTTTTSGTHPTRSSVTASSAAASSNAIARSFNTFFDFADASVHSKLAVIQDGSTLNQAMTEAVATPFATAATGARVDASTVLGAQACASVALPSPCARVSYDVVGTDDAVILPSTDGYAVSIDGHWLVAKTSACGLFELFYQASGKPGTPPGC